MFASLGRFAYRHRWWVIAGWLGVLVAGVVFGSSVFGRLDSGAGTYADYESAEVGRRLAEFGGVDADVWVLLDGMAVSDPQLRSDVADLVRETRVIGRIAANPAVSEQHGRKYV